jgi:Cu/Zn superoxide dismutase
VQKLNLFVTGAVLGLALVVAGAAGARPQATTIRVAAQMTAANETPTPKGDVANARGTFTATVTKSGTGATIAWRLEFSGLTGNAIAAHIHVAPRGQPGPVRVPLCAPCTSGVTGTATIDAAVLEAIQTDRAYVNVHTPTNPAGEIRDQISTVASIRTVLNSGQERPKPKGKRRGSGVFTATVTKSGASGEITWRLTFKQLSGRAVAAHIHRGARGRTGPVVVSLCAPCRSGARGTATLSPAVLAALEAGTAYVNVHTVRNPAGEIRGQIRAVPLTIS